MKRAVLVPTAAVVGVIVALTGCSASKAPQASGSLPGPATPAAADPVIAVARTGPATGSAASYLEPVRINVANGTFASVQVTASSGGQALEGSVSADKGSWVSEVPPRPASKYQVTASVADSSGKVRDRSLTFTVASVPADHRLGFSVIPRDGSTVGIGQPIVVRFLTPVTRKAAVEKVMLVDTKSPAGTAVEGSWHWLSASEAHWRPKAFWTPGTTVKLSMRIAGVRASDDRYGRRDYSHTFTIGPSHVTQVDAVSRLTKVYRDGKLVGTWPSGTGMKGLETYSGTYIVLGKAAVIQMDSCSARITCDKKDPDYYDEKEYWATRITNSGTFLHAAGWDKLLGKANVSHGCVHLSDADAEDFYRHATIGDVVVVTRTGRGPAERIATQDPGLYDWNLSWTAWQAGSALT